MKTPKFRNGSRAARKRNNKQARTVKAKQRREKRDASPANLAELRKLFPA